MSVLAWDAYNDSDQIFFVLFTLSEWIREKEKRTLKTNTQGKAWVLRLYFSFVLYRIEVEISLISLVSCNPGFLYDLLKKPGSALMN